MPEQSVLIGAELLEAQAARVQARDRLAYTNEEAIVLRQAAKAAEKEVVELRRALEERLRIVSEGYREARRNLATTGQQLRTVQAEFASVERELAAGQEGETPERLATLQTEREGYLQRLQDLETELQRHQENLETAKADAMRDDPDAAELGAQHDEAVARHQEAYDRLKDWLDAHPAIQALDQGQPAP